MSVKRAAIKVALKFSSDSLIGQDLATWPAGKERASRLRDLAVAGLVHGTAIQARSKELGEVLAALGNMPTHSRREAPADPETETTAPGSAFAADDLIAQFLPDLGAGRRSAA